MTDANQVHIERALAVERMYPTWEARYRTSEIERFQDEQIDELAWMIGAHAGTEVLDVGTGAGINAIRLARRGVRVRALDYADTVLDTARSNVRTAGVEDLVTLERQDMRALDLPDASFQRVLCWGVLMHIPEIEQAIAELSRILAPGGYLVVCEGNVRSFDEVGLRVLDLFGRTTHSRRSASGRERWRDTPAGSLLARRTDIPWLIRAFEGHGLVLRARLACQLTEAYAYLREGTVAARLVDRLNRGWYHVVRSPRLASDNFVILQRPAPEEDA